jgi:hypothetical protein
MLSRTIMHRAWFIIGFGMDKKGYGVMKGKRKDESG